MRLILIETWVNGILDSLDVGGHVEDHRVELKRDWIDARQAARRLAGHANSAADDIILWLVGVDEKARQVVGAQAPDLASWWPQVEAEFADQIAPEMTAVAMKKHDIPFMALAFKTDRAPYLVRNEEFGKLKGQKMAWEVPFRVGTEVRTATRNQLLRLLAPSLPLPRHEMVSAGVVLHAPERKEKWVQKCVADAVFYLVAPDDNALTIDSRACKTSVEVTGFFPTTTVGVPHLKHLGISGGMSGVETGGHVLTLRGTSLIHLKVEGEVPSIGNQYAEDARLTVKIRPIGYDRSVAFSYALALQPSNSLTGITHSFVAQNMLPV
jgi:hypothetical protein